MSLKDKVIIELSTVNPVNGEYYYTEIALPATDAEIEDGKQRARIFGYSNKWADIGVLSCSRLPELTDTRMDAPTLAELNFFAQRIQTLSEPEIIAMNGIFNLEKQQGKFEDGLTMKHLINLTYGLDSVAVVMGIQTNEQLGEFVVDNELEEFISEMPDEGFQYLNRAEIGKAHRKSEGGIFVDGAYVATATYQYPKFYDGVALPRDSNSEYGNGVFRLRIAGEPESDEEAEKFAQTAEWVALPISEDAAEAIAKKNNEMCIEGCVYYGFKSALPGIDEELFDSMEKFDRLNKLAQQYMDLSNSDKVKFKAILQNEQPETLDHALRLSYMTDEYDFSYYPDSTAAFASEYLTHHLPTNFDPEYLDSLPLTQFGDRILNRLNAKLTGYGVISERGGNLHDLVPYREEQDITQNNDEQMGGMQM